MSYLCRSLKELVELDNRVKSLGVFIAYTASWGTAPPQAPSMLTSSPS